MPTEDPLVAGLIIYETNTAGHIIYCKYPVGGALPTLTNHFAVGCELIDASGKHYTNTGTTTTPSWDSMTDISTSEIADAGVTLAKLATGIKPSHVIKFFKLGSTITTTALVGVAVGDLVVTIVADGTVTVGTVGTADTLPADPADTSYVIVLRAVA